jgi:hypothetical protein
MVQVDVFWSYGLASGLTLAASKPLAKVPDVWGNKYLVGILLWIAALFAPSGMYLLWQFPGWETMYVAGSHADIPAWLVALFGITNVTQGLLGYYVTSKYIRAGKMGAAKLQAVWSHVAMFFILFVGWDGTGFLRFTHTGTREDFLAGNLRPWYEWLTSDVAFTLIGMGVILVPSYIYMCRRWMRD